MLKPLGIIPLTHPMAGLTRVYEVVILLFGDTFGAGMI